MQSLAEQLAGIRNIQVSRPAGDVRARLAAVRRGIVINLADDGPPERGGHDPDVPTVLTGWQVVGPLMIGHTADFTDPGTPIVVREADTVLPGPDGTGYAEGRCRSCVAKPFLASSSGQALMILQHERRCPALDALLRLAGGAT